MPNWYTCFFSIPEWCDSVIGLQATVLATVYAPHCWGFNLGSESLTFEPVLVARAG